MAEVWHLPPTAEFQYGIDSWYVRAEPRYDARPVGVLQLGQEFPVVDRQGDWLQIADDKRGIFGWTCFKLHPAQGGVTVLAPVDAAPEELVAISVPVEPPALARTRSNAQDVHSLLLELLDRRKAYESVADSCAFEKFRAARAVQETLDTLELFGVGPDEVHAMADRYQGFTPGDKLDQLDLSRAVSFDHSEFSNPRQESCWLSTMFQSLWHSRVFHAIFEQVIRPQLPHVSNTALQALHETWDMYEKAAQTGQTVSVKPLVAAWGPGYGDCTEALGKLQTMKQFGDLFAIVPVPWTGRAPTAKQLAQLVEQMGVRDTPLVALDLSFPALKKQSMQTLALHLGPKGSSDEASVGGHLRLVAMICYMESYAHYVVFCRSLTNDSEWIFFNDIPGTGSRGSMHRIVGWDRVAYSCAKYGACPKMLLYEDERAALEFVKKRCRAQPAVTQSRSGECTMC